jgi:hypothetical protein
MTESYIHQIIPHRMKELEYKRYHEHHRDFIMDAESMLTIQAYNELYFIVDDPIGIIVASDYGMYDSTDEPLEENVHQHRGEIIIQNPGMEKRRIKFIHVIMVN